MADRLTPTEQNALRWVLLIEWWDKVNTGPKYTDKDRATLLPHRIAILRGD